MLCRYFIILQRSSIANRIAVQQPRYECAIILSCVSWPSKVIMVMERFDWKSNGKLYLQGSQTYLVSLSMLLGGGILGLPDTLDKSGFYPFLVTFSLNYGIQVVVIHQMTEVLQYARVILSKSPDGFSEAIGIRQHLDAVQDTSELQQNTDYGTMGERSRNAVEGVNRTDSKYQNSELSGPNVYSIGKLFLNRYMQAAFLFSILFVFISILISYSLAGSQAYANILQISAGSVTPYFTWILAFLVVFGYRIVKTTVALLTLVKGTLIFVTIVVTVYVGGSNSRTIVDDWTYIDQPFLLGVVTLVGVNTLMPVLFENFQADKKHMAVFRNSIIAALTTCFVLDILWCWSVLKIVPQTTDTCNSVDSMTIDMWTTPSGFNTCDPTLTIAGAKERGQIATAPLTKILLKNHDSLKWIALAIQLFIAISTTVSFIIAATSMHHAMCGWVDDVISRHPERMMFKDCFPSLQKNFAWRAAVGMLSYAIVYTVAVFNPKGFIVILERLVSLTGALITGIFPFFWLHAVKSEKYNHINVELKSASYLRHSHYLTLIFFSVVVVYDIVSWIIGR